MKGLAAVVAGILLGACARPSLTLIPEAELPGDVYGSPIPETVVDLPERASVYLVRDGLLVEVRRRLTPAASLPEALLVALLTGPPGASAIPSGTRLLGFHPDGEGIATVDLSDEFERGGTGRSLALRVAQIVCTLAKDPNILAVLFAIEGIPTPVIGGREEVLNRPVTCRDYDRLRAGDEAENPS